EDWLHHGFLDAYLGGDMAGPLMRADIVSSVKRLLSLAPISAALCPASDDALSQEPEPASQDAPMTCEGLQDGWYCARNPAIVGYSGGKGIVECRSDAIASALDCPATCTSEAQGTNDHCCGDGH